MSQQELSGSWALVTGASQGIGAAIADALAQAGVNLILTARERPDSSLPVVTERARLLGVEAHYLFADLLNPDEVIELGQAALGVHAPISILVNNAGIVRGMPAIEETPATWDATMAVNLRAPFLLSQQLAPAMMAEGWGRIVMIGSAAGIVGFPNRASYAASKGGLAMLTRQLAVEWGPSGITVNCVAPTVTLTPMAQQAWADDKKRTAMENRIPVRRLAQPGEVAQAILSLLGPHSGMINGITLPVDGGYTIQ